MRLSNELWRWPEASVMGRKFAAGVGERQPQILRLTTPKLNPANEDPFAGTLKNVWGPVRSG